MKNTEVLRILIKNGWYIKRQKGSHATLKHPDKKNIITVPIHKGKEMPTGTANAILKQAGLK